MISPVGFLGPARADLPGDLPAEKLHLLELLASEEKPLLGTSLTKVIDRVSQRISETLGTSTTNAYRTVDDVFRAVRLGGPGADGLSEAPVKIITVPTTLTGLQEVEADWVVQADLTFDNAEVVFKNTQRQHNAIVLDPNVKLTIRDSTIREEDGDRASYGFIISQGETVIERTDISEILIAPLSIAGNHFPTSSIVDNTFDNILTAFQTDQNAEVARNIFTRNYAALAVSNGVSELGAADPHVHDNVFEMNEIGIFVDSALFDANGNPINYDGAGLYEKNRISANFLGVWCIGDGDSDDNGVVDDRAEFKTSNIDENYGDAISGLRGITIVLPNGEEVTVSNSHCVYDGNYYGGAGDASDSKFLSLDDEDINIQNAANALPDAPALPWAVRKITVATTWNNANAPPLINGPVVVKDAGKLTVNGITVDMNGFAIGAKLKGEMDLTNVDFADGTQVFHRNLEDNFDGVNVLGSALFEGIISHRNSGTILDFESLNAGPNAAGAILFSGQLADDQAWAPTLRDSNLANAAIGILTVINKPTIDGNTIEDINGQALVAALAPGIVLTDNTFRRVLTAIGGQLNTLTSTDNTYDGGLAGFFSGALNTVSFTNDIFTNYVLAWFSQLDTAPAVTSTLFAHNLYGMGVAAGTGTATNVNFIDNYGPGPFTMDVVILDGVPPAGRITCTNCWLEDDETQEGSVDGTFALAENAVPEPSWWDDRVIVDNEVKELSGTLDGPVVAKKGGKIKVVDADLNLNAFSIGAKGVGDLADEDTGKIEIRRSSLSGGSTIGMQSDDVVIENSRFSNFRADVLSVYKHLPTVSCNSFEDSLRVAWVFKGAEGDTFDFSQNLVQRVDDMRIGFDRRIPGYVEDTVITDNGFVDTLFTTRRSGRGTMNFENNNALTVNVGFRDFGFTTNDEHNPPKADVSDNYWFHNTGPNVLRVANNGFVQAVLHDGLGATLLLQNNPGGGLATWEPFKTSPTAIDPCADFRFSPTTPTEVQQASFVDRSIDPSGLGIVERTWVWGDGTSDTTSAASILHRFPDGGTFTVDLTVETEGGKTATVSKTITVTHVAPVADFATNIVNELNPVDFTDTSTHPNTPNDDPPLGWLYDWDFNGEGSSTTRNPAFDFEDGGTKSITLVATDDDGLSGTRTKTITVPHVAPDCDFSFSPGSPSETNSVVFTDLSTHPNAPVDDITEWDWNFGDGTTSTAQNPPGHKFPDGDTYTVSLTVTDDDNQSCTVSKSVSVSHVAPNANFAFAPAGPTELTPVAFTDTSTHPNSPNDAPPAGWTFDWDFNGEGSSTARNPSFDFADGGSKTVTLDVTDNDGLPGSVSKTVGVAHVAPAAAFSFAPNAPDVDEPVQFTDLSTHPNAPVDAVSSWLWTFGDGATSTDQNPSHAFATQDTFTVCLEVGDNDGLTSSVCRAVSVGNFPPTAVFTFTPEDPDDTEVVSFDASESIDEDGQIVSYEWDFGDGASATGVTADHQFGDDGTFTVTLTVTDDRGGVGIATALVTVSNVPPVAAFAFAPNPPFEDEAIQFTDLSSDADNPAPFVSNRFWTFGDGASSTDTDPTHMFADPGTYTVTLTVTDNDGAEHSASQELFVCQRLLDTPFGPVGGGTGSGGLGLHVCTRLQI